jgi:toxin ParE1/3/4
MKLRFTRRAAQDLADIADYIRKQNPQVALRVRAAILESLQNLVLFPQIGRRQKVEGVRKLVTRHYFITQMPVAACSTIARHSSRVS